MTSFTENELKLMSIEELKKVFVILASNLEDTTPVAQEMAARAKKIMFKEISDTHH
jgi:Zn-finger domain-containing protein